MSARAQELRDAVRHYAVIDVAADATGEIVATPGAGKRIVVLHYTIAQGTAAGTLTWKSAATAISGVMTGNKDLTLSEASSESGLMETAANEALNLTTATCTADGHCTYVVLDA